MSTRRASRLKMRLDMARKAIADLETRTDLTADQRIKLMEMVERLTAGRYLKPGRPSNKAKQGIFQ